MGSLPPQAAGIPELRHRGAPICKKAALVETAESQERLGWRPQRRAATVAETLRPPPSVRSVEPLQALTRWSCRPAGTSAGCPACLAGALGWTWQARELAIRQNQGWYSLWRFQALSDPATGSGPWAGSAVQPMILWSTQQLEDASALPRRPDRVRSALLAAPGLAHSAKHLAFCLPRLRH